ncbi:olfactory receptor 13C9-like [Ranitomeya variabilis]|uniref:olfactory receptor 13C9-like n=1 Tax=Ranitomeya variabilis TaxID=490064 RepID=UPI004055B546
MDPGNQTTFSEFVLTGFSQSLPKRTVLFLLFLICYALTIFGNGFLIFTVAVSPRIHTPMYFFLSNLSFLDLCYSSNSLPKMLFDVFSKKRRISVIGCLTQMYIGLFLGGTECILLAVMAYDRYVAICLPLRYTTIMSWRVCWSITVIMWSGIFIISTAPTMARPLVFCSKNQMDHFACEILTLLELACGDISFYKMAIVIISFFTLLSPLIFIVISYICIIVAVLNISSEGGRSKAFSTSASHLTVVIMFYGTSLTMYMGHTKHFSSSFKYISLMYGVVTPVLNPMIYSLRNNEVKQAFQNIFVNYLKKQNV